MHYKKRHIHDILGRTKFFCHTYDTSMMIIVTKPGIIIDVVGSYFYDKKSRQKMGFSSWAGRRCNCMTFFGPSMTEKIMVEARARKISGSSRLRWVVGAERCTVVCEFLLCTRVCARRWDLTKPERGVRLLNLSDCTSYVTEPER